MQPTLYFPLVFIHILCENVASNIETKKNSLFIAVVQLGRKWNLFYSTILRACSAAVFFLRRQFWLLKKRVDKIYPRIIWFFALDIKPNIIIYSNDGVATTQLHQEKKKVRLHLICYFAYFCSLGIEHIISTDVTMKSSIRNKQKLTTTAEVSRNT